MDRADHIRWLRGELRRHPQPCRCMDCASAAGELLYLGTDPADPVAADMTAQVVERAA
jgi:hypothetical protein